MEGKDETRALDRVSERLSLRFPQVATELVRELVLALAVEFEGAVVRDYVPVLVEREAAERLRSGAPGPGRTTPSP